MTDASAKIEPIQSLRGVAITAVFLTHTVIWYAFFDLFGVAQAYHVGDLGVDLFFVISGFVVTMSLHKRGFGAGSFYVRRLFRLLPAMLVMLAVGATTALVAKNYFPEWPFNLNTEHQSEPFWQAGHVLTTWFTVRSFLGLPNEYCFNHCWSLNVEEQFYAGMGLFCLLVWAVRRKAHPDRVLWVLGVSAGVLCAALHAARVYRSDVVPYLDRQAPAVLARFVQYAIHFRFDFLFSGVALYAASRLVRYRPPANLLTSAVLVVATFGPFLYTGWTGVRANAADNGLVARTAYLVANASFLLAVLLASQGVPLVPPGSIAGRTLLYLGERSYALYLLHIPITLITWMLLFRFLPKAMVSGVMTMGVCYFLSTAALSLPAAHLLHRFVELPFIALGARLTKRWFPSGEAASLQLALTAETPAQIDKAA